MLEKPTLYDSDQEAWDAVAVHRPNVAIMARHFSEVTAMESALGYGPSVIIKWVRKRGGVSLDADRRARTWLELQARTVAATHADKPAGALLLVACQDPNKVTKVLQLMGCEVTEI
jgi:hypothetical protein